MIYFDNAATTKVCPEAAEAALRCMTEDFGNPSSTHGPGRTARAALKNARETVARIAGAAPEEIFFTSGGTEGDNWAIRSACRRMRHKGKHIISSAAEHEAVLKSLELMTADGWEVTLLSPGPDGAILPEQAAAAVREDTVLVSLMMVNNETGAVTDISAVSKAVRAVKSDVLIHTDAVQGFLKIPFSAKNLGADLMTMSGHKIHAPKGIGALYVRRGLRLPPLLPGGGQENGMRSGTENMPGICAFAAAAEAAARDREAYDRMNALRQFMIDTLSDAIPELVVIGGGAPHILNISLPGYKSEVLLNFLDAEGICISKGSACRKGARSHVLEAMGLPAKVIDGSVRVSLSRFSTREDAEAFCRGLLNAKEKLYKTL